MSKALASFLLFGLMPAALPAGELSRYRDFKFGTDLPTVAKQMGASSSRAKAIHIRPALIQELEWRPQPLGFSSKSEPVQDVVFTFYDGQLFRIAVNYDSHETEGLTAEDIVEVISVTFGAAVKAGDLPKAAAGSYGDQDEIVARWQDSQYRFDLVRSRDEYDFKLVGVLKKLEAPAQAAILEAARLDKQEAPQRDAARVLTEEDAAKDKLAKARLVNKPKFKP
jgi:hypothetical protein